MPKRTKLQQKIDILEAELQFASTRIAGMGKILADSRRWIDAHIVRNPDTAKLLGVEQWYGTTGAVAVLAAGYRILLKAVKAQRSKNAPKLTKTERIWLQSVLAEK